MDGAFFAAHLSAFDFAADSALVAEKGGVYAHCPSAGGGRRRDATLSGGAGQGHGGSISASTTHSNDYVENLKLAVLYGQARHALLASDG